MVIFELRHKKTAMYKNSFFTGQPIFTQLLSFIPMQIVQKLVRQHGTDHYCKKFMSHDHIVSMLYQGFYQCQSLRELTTGLQANAQRLGHLGLSTPPTLYAGRC